MPDEEAQQYADVAPAGHALASNRQVIDASDMVFYAGNATRAAGWERPQRGENIIGSHVTDHWPTIMSLAVKR